MKTYKLTTLISMRDLDTFKEFIESENTNSTSSKPKAKYTEYGDEMPDFVNVEITGFVSTHAIFGFGCRWVLHKMPF